MLAAFVAAVPLLANAQETDDTKAALPWERAGPSTLPSPALLKLDEPPPNQIKPPPKGKPSWLTTVPFGKPSSTVSQPLPKGPQMLQAVPVQGVDAIEVTEPAVPSTAPLEADPAKENPEIPTEETSPIFSGKNVPTPRKIILRALNKVTGQSELIEARPGETVRFGKLDIKSISCQVSDPTSPLDYAGLFEMNEYIPELPQPKRLFRGWMYATSPSVTALEHPVYDVTMVECVTDVASRAKVKKETEEEAPKTAEPPVDEDEAVLD